MWSLALLAVAEAACVALAIAHDRRLRSVFGDDLRGIVAEVSRLPVPDRPRRARDRARHPEEIARLLGEAAGESDPAVRAIEIDATLAEVARRLDAASGWTSTALRGAIAFGAIHAFLVQGVVGAVGLASGVVIGGFVAALLRNARRTEQEGRLAVDALVNALVGHRATTRREGRDRRRASGEREPASLSSDETFRVPYRELPTGSAVFPPFGPPCEARTQALLRRGETR